MTDFVSIYIATELNTKEYRVVMRHEQAHIWAGHLRRRPKALTIESAAAWKIAAEMEIARNIYDEDDIATIVEPRSRLNGIYLPDTIAGLPDDLLVAEDIYDWLLAHPAKNPSCTGCACGTKHEGEHPETPGGASPAPISEVRDALDYLEASDAASRSASDRYAALLRRPPSMTECLDAALRYRMERERTYLRPSRRSSPGLILRGRRSVPRPPRVEIYIDRSGSFTPSKTDSAERALDILLTRYRASIKADTWYFGDGCISAQDIESGGDTPYHLVAEQITRSTPKIAIIITDDDAPAQDIRATPAGVSVICIPIGCASTRSAAAIGARDVVIA
jgi:hypothetical protein